MCLKKTLIVGLLEKIFSYEYKKLISPTADNMLKTTTTKKKNKTEQNKIPPPTKCKEKWTIYESQCFRGRA